MRFSGGRVASPSVTDSPTVSQLWRTVEVVCSFSGVEDKAHEVVGIPPDNLDGVVKYVREILSGSIHPQLSTLRSIT